MRLKDFVVGVTNDDPVTKPPDFKQYRYVQYNGTLPPHVKADLTFPPSDERFQYVIVQMQFDYKATLCIAEVQVYSKGI